MSFAIFLFIATMSEFSRARNIFNSAKFGYRGDVHLCRLVFKDPFIHASDEKRYQLGMQDGGPKKSFLFPMKFIGHEDGIYVDVNGGRDW